MFFGRAAALVTCALIVAGCSTTTPAERMAQQQASCSNYGFKLGTDAYSNCMMQMDLAAKEEDAARRARIGASLAAMGQSMQPRRPVTCNTFGSGYRTGNSAFGNATTTCY